MPEAGHALRAHPSGLFVRFARFPETSGWFAGFTTRRAGDDLAPVLDQLGTPGRPVFRLSQQHGCRVLPVRDDDRPGGSLPEADGLATARRGVVVAVAAADCVPVLLFDSHRQAGAVLHAGWRGTRSAIVAEGVRTLHQAWGCRAEDISAALGPCIGPCCYQVGPEVVRAFTEAGQPAETIVQRRDGSLFLDLAMANRRILERTGVRPDQIRVAGLCTRCRSDLFPSHRRDGPAAGRFLGFLGSFPSS